MTTITTSKGEFVLIEVSKDLKLFTAILPHLNATFLCTTDTITEEIAKEIVGHKEYNGWVWFYSYKRKAYCLSTALQSLKSLLQSHNLSLDKTYAICKKIN
jgi:hypothetical protein